MIADIAVGRPPLPKEHGGWAMLLTPPIVALVAAGPDLLGLLAVTGWLFAYCLRGPVEALLGTAPTGRAGLQQVAPAVARLWLMVFGLAAVGTLAPVIWVRPRVLLWLGLAAVALGLLMALMLSGRTRSITAGLLGAAGLMTGGPLYYEAAFGSVGAAGWTLALAGLAFFGGSVFRVKTLARERRSASFRWVSVAVHAATLAVATWAAALGLASWLVPLALGLTLVWAVYGAVRAGGAVNLATIGKGEIVVTVLFGVLMMAGL